MPGAAWLILPTYNEIENVELIVAAASEQLRRAVGEDFKILIVDDGSPDGTGAAADRLAAADAHIEVLHRTTKNGIGPAYIAGFGHALRNDAALLMEMDSDFSHDPADLPRLIAAVTDRGADLALGSRYVDGGGVADWGLLPRLLSPGGPPYPPLPPRLPTPDPPGAFHAVRP